MPSVPGSAVETLYILHGDWLRGLMRRRLGCAETARELSQDLFVRLLGRPVLPEMREPRAYLARIAHGLVVDHRRRQALEEALLETLAQQTESVTPSLESHYLLIDALARIDAMLAGLRERTREVFLLSRLDGLSYPVIARRLGVSVSTVEKDVARALRHCYGVMMGQGLVAGEGG